MSVAVYLSVVAALLSLVSAFLATWMAMEMTRLEREIRKLKRDQPQFFGPVKQWPYDEHHTAEDIAYFEDQRIPPFLRRRQ